MKGYKPRSLVWLLKMVMDIASMRCRSDTNVAELNIQTKSAFFAKTCPFRLLGWCKCE